MSRSAALAFALGLASCGGKVDSTLFGKEVERYFHRLNADEMARRDLLLTQIDGYGKNPAATPPLGLQYNSYQFNAKGFILLDLPCRNADCGDISAVVDYYGAERLCTRCGSVLLKAKPKEGAGDTTAWLAGETKAVTLPAKIKSADEISQWLASAQGKPALVPMFVVPETAKSDSAIAICVRRNWSFDSMGKSPIDVSKMGDSKWKSEIKTDYLPGGGGKVGPGFHRVDGMYLEMFTFEFAGGAARPVKRLSGSSVANPSQEIRNLRARQEIR